MIPNPLTGDIVRVRCTNARTNLVVLFDTNHRRYVQGLLLHTFAELATDMDVVLEQHISPLPYPLVVNCDLYGQFLRTQIDLRVARLDLPSGHPLFQPDTVAVALGGYRGMPLAGPADPRWQEKERLLADELRPLTRPFWSGFRW